MILCENESWANIKKKKKMTKPFFALKRVVPLKVHPYFLVIFWLIN